MTDPTRALLSRVAEFLAGLSDADVAALAEGRARLAVLPAAGATPPDTEVDGGPAPGRTAAPDGAAVERAHAALATMARRDEGTAYLASWTSRELRALAARVGLRGVTGLRKTDLVNRIVDRTIGFRLDSAAIRRR